MRPGPDIDPRPGELDWALLGQVEVEPLPSSGATFEIDTDAPLGTVVA